MKALILTLGFAMLAGCGAPTDVASAAEIQAILDQASGKGDLGQGDLCEAIGQPSQCNICDHISRFDAIDTMAETTLSAIVRGRFCTPANEPASEASEPTDTSSNRLEITLESGKVLIDLYPHLAPKHVERIMTLAQRGDYDNVAFHRVIEGFMAQTGDVQYGDLETSYDARRVGTGESELPDLQAEFSEIHFERGVVGMARAARSDSANSQFFIMLDRARHLDSQHTVVGRVVEGMELVDGIKRGGRASNGAVTDPDRMVSVRIVAD